MNNSEALSWLATIFNIDETELHIDAQRDELEAWDSMGTLMLMAELDEQYNVTLTEDELSGLSSIKDLFKILGNYNIVVDDG